MREVKVNELIKEVEAIVVGSDHREILGVEYVFRVETKL